LESLDCLAIAAQLFWQEFERDRTAQLGVFGLLDCTHAPDANLFDDRKMRNRLADLGHAYLLVEVSYMLIDASVNLDGTDAYYMRMGRKEEEESWIEDF
jgi:hypothetical protein